MKFEACVVLNGTRQWVEFDADNIKHAAEIANVAMFKKREREGLPRVEGSAMRTVEVREV